MPDNELKTVLITGGAGFIGSNFVSMFARRYPQVKVINLDKLTYAGKIENQQDCEGLENYEFVRGDIADAELTERLFSERHITGVINFAAETHVDNSIADPSAFMQTNLMGTFNLLETARRHWLDAGGAVRVPHRFHHISTDEVYGTLGLDGGAFSEDSPYAPNSPYSASKAGSDFMVRAYNRTYGMNCVITNCSNNYGPRQHAEKLIPHMIKMALSGKPLPVYGNGSNVRDWLYVGDHCEALDLVFHKGKSGESYNIGGRGEQDNLSVVRAICAALDSLRPRADGQSYGTQIAFVTDRPGHDLRYAINPQRISGELGWQPKVSFAKGLELTVKWYLEHDERLA